MSQSDQAVEQGTEQAVGQIIEGNTVTGGVLLRSSNVEFTFPRSTGTDTAKTELTFPPGTETTHIVLQGFDVNYLSEDYELKDLQISLKIQEKTATCTVTLRDRNPNTREWRASVTGLVTFFGKP